MTSQPPAAAPWPAHLQAAAAALEAQRAALGGAAVDAALAALRATAAPTSAPQAQAAAAGAATGPQRRQVTILFMDVVGSTRLSQQLDPEDIQLVLDGLLARATRMVERHDGRVLQYAGDSLLAAFGADRVQEDDAESALRAGLALLALGREQGAEVLRRFGHHGFDVRLGVHTGDVVLGGGVDAEGSIRGMAVNVAARLEQLAPPGGLRISQETYRHVRGLFDLELQPPMELKGFDAPVPSYLVRGARSRAFTEVRRGLDGIATPLLGRDAELAALQAAWSASRASGTLHAATLMADAGLGKSRLLAEFERSLLGPGEPPLRLHGRSHPHSRSQPHGLLRDLLCRHFEIAESDDQAAARDKLQAGWQRDGGTAAEAALLGQLIGMDFGAHPEVQGVANDARQLRARAHRAGMQWIGRLARRAGGAVVLLDDVHWSDDGSLDFIDLLARAHFEAPVLLLCATRPSLLEHRADWGAGWPRHTLLRLPPLPGRGEALLAAWLEPARGVPPALREMLLAQADGNPFYLEELVQMLIDEHVVDTRSQPWTVAVQRLGSLKVPTTLTGVLQARLDNLPAPERVLLQRASVVGTVFWDAALAIEGPAPAPDTLLPTLERRGPVQRQANSEFEGSTEYRFRHHLLHQVTYDTVLRRERVSWHRATAQWLLAMSGQRLGEHAAAIGLHFERAGDPVQAAQFYARAGGAAHAAAMFATALELRERALALMPDGGSADRVHLLVALATTCNSLGRRDEQRRHADEAARLADQLGDPLLQIDAHSAATLVRMVMGRWDEGIASADHVIALAEALGEPQRAAMTMADKAYAASMIGRLEDAEALLRRALALTVDLPSTRMTALSRLAHLARVQGRPAEQLACLAEAVALAEAGSHRRYLAGLQNNLAVAEANYGNAEAARALLVSSLAGMRAIGDRGGEGYARWALAEMDHQAGDWAAARQGCDEALAHARASRDGGLEQQLLEMSARLALDGGDPDRAAEALAQTARDDEAGDSLPRVEAVRLWLLRGENDRAIAAIRRWLAWAERDGAQLGDAAIAQRWQWVQAMRACGLADEAQRTLRRALAHVRHVAASLPPERRETFCTRVPAHRAVLDAAQAAGLVADSPAPGAAAA